MDSATLEPMDVYQPFEPDELFDPLFDGPVDPEQASLEDLAEREVAAEYEPVDVRALGAAYVARYGRRCDEAAEDSLARFERVNPALVARANGAIQAAARRQMAGRA